MILVIDNFDSFTYNLTAMLNEDFIVVRNNDVHLLEIKTKGIIISPGPGKPKDSGFCMEILDKRHKETPILGICLGHQIIGDYFGGRTVKALKPMHGKISQVFHSQNDTFKNIENPVNVMRYHSLVIENQSMPTCLEIIGKTQEGEIMALKHKELPIWGIQFHPESILTEYGNLMIENWLQMMQQQN